MSYYLDKDDKPYGYFDSKKYGKIPAYRYIDTRDDKLRYVVKLPDGSLRFYDRLDHFGRSNPKSEFIIATLTIVVILTYIAKEGHFLTASVFLIAYFIFIYLLLKRKTE